MFAIACTQTHFFQPEQQRRSHRRLIRRCITDCSFRWSCCKKMTVNHIQLLWIPYSQRARLGKRNIYISPSFSWTNTETGFLPRLPVVSFIASVLESLGSLAIVLSRTTDYFRVYRPAHGQFYWLVTLPRFWSTNQRVRNYSNVGMWKLGPAPKAGIGLIDRIIPAEIFLVETSSGRQQTPEPSVVSRAERAWQPTGVF